MTKTHFRKHSTTIVSRLRNAESNVITKISRTAHNFRGLKSQQYNTTQAKYLRY
jgi:hypothetical protein